MKIAIVNPPPFNFNEPQYDTPEFTRLSLACLAAFLREFGYAELLLIDAKFERIGYGEIRQRLMEFSPDVVGHTAFTNEIVQAGHSAAVVRSVADRLHKPIFNVLGGVHVSAMPDETMNEFPWFEFGVLGEGEETFYQLVRAIEECDGQISQNVEKFSAISGLIFRTENNSRSGNLITTALRAKIEDQTTLPVPAWDLLPKSPVVTVMTSRGCPFACNFCMNPNGRVVRKRDVDHFLQEVKWVTHERDAKHVLICDEIMTVDKERTHQILDGMIDIGFGDKYTFNAQTHVNCVDEPLLRKIKKAGVTTLGFGIESADPETLAKMGKGTKLQTIKSTVDLAKKCKVGLTTFFILGQPNETVMSAWRSVWFTVRINPVVPIFGIMVPYPGTKIWSWAKKGEMGYRLNSFDWNDYNKQIGNALTMQHVSRKQLEILQFVGYLLVFMVNLRFLELARFIWKYKSEGFTVIKKIIGISFKEKAYHLELLKLETEEIENQQKRQLPSAA